MDFSEILSRAWEITWKHKVLWLFGILIALTSQSGNGSSSGGGSSTSYQYDIPSEGVDILPDNWLMLINQTIEFLESIPAEVYFFIIVGIFILAVVFMIVNIMLSALGKTGMVKGALLVENEELEGETLRFGEVFTSLKPFYWRVLGLNLIVAVVFIAIFLLFFAIFAGIGILTFGVGIFCLIPLLCLLVPVVLVLSIFVNQSIVAMVVEDLNIIEAFQRGWDVFTNNLGNLIVMGLILIIGSFVINLVIGLPIALVVTPAVISTILGLMSGTQGLVFGGIGTALICLIAYWPISLLLRGILHSYVETAWTLTFLRLTGDTR
jgi:hypothetical protein